jgi:DNA-binding transcriptional ArsR family regulator
MKDGPDIAMIASLLGDPARSNMVMALMAGDELSASTLAQEAGVTPPTATGHLNRLVTSGLLRVRRDGRHRYFRIADGDVADAVESLIAIATRVGNFRTRPGSKDAAMRRARSCYDHLAGEIAVKLCAHWLALRVLRRYGGAIRLTRKGKDFLADRGIAMNILARNAHGLCRTCVDWSERRPHLGGPLGTAILSLAVARGWATRKRGQRAVFISKSGEENFVRWYS